MEKIQTFREDFLTINNEAQQNLDLLRNARDLSQKNNTNIEELRRLLPAAELAAEDICRDTENSLKFSQDINACKRNDRELYKANKRAARRIAKSLSVKHKQAQRALSAIKAVTK